MKILKYLPIVAAALLSFSCQEVEKTYAAPADEVQAPVLNAHADIVVEETTLSNNVTFTWSEVDYGYPAQITYSLYVVYGGAESGQALPAHMKLFPIPDEDLVANPNLTQNKGY